MLNNCVPRRTHPGHQWKHRNSWRKRERDFPQDRSGLQRGPTKIYAVGEVPSRESADPASSGGAARLRQETRAVYGPAPRERETMQECSTLREDRQGTRPSQVCSMQADVSVEIAPTWIECGPRLVKVGANPVELLQSWSSSLQHRDIRMRIGPRLARMAGFRLDSANLGASSTIVVGRIWRGVEQLWSFTGV